MEYPGRRGISPAHGAPYIPGASWAIASRPVAQGQALAVTGLLFFAALRFKFFRKDMKARLIDRLSCVEVGFVVENSRNRKDPILERQELFSRAYLSSE